MAIAAELYAKTGEVAQLWVTGHSLGAGLGSLYYTYQLLHAAKPESAHFALRDAYLYGCPSAGDAGFVSGFEGLYNDEGNTSTLFRIRNNDDIVAVVPPGLAVRFHYLSSWGLHQLIGEQNARDNRLSLNPSGLLDYGQIGIELRLLPGGNAPFAKVVPESVPPGTQITVVQSPQSTKQSVGVGSPHNPLKTVERIGTVLAPFIANHIPGQYYTSLFKMSDPDALAKATNNKDHFVNLRYDDVYKKNASAGLYL